MGEVVHIHHDTADRQVGRAIQSWRLACGLSLASVAGATGLSVDQLHSYEHGMLRAPVEHLFRIALILDVSPRRLLSVLKSQSPQ